MRGIVQLFFLWVFVDEDDNVATLEGPPVTHSRKSLAEQGDQVMPLWDPPGYQSQYPRMKGKFSQQTSDADSAIGMVRVVCVHYAMCVYCES